jgi:hypothetical protein
MPFKHFIIFYQLIFFKTLSTMFSRRILTYWNIYFWKFLKISKHIFHGYFANFEKNSKLIFQKYFWNFCKLPKYNLFSIRNHYNELTHLMENFLKTILHKPYKKMMLNVNKNQIWVMDSSHISPWLGLHFRRIFFYNRL